MAEAKKAAATPAVPDPDPTPEPAVLLRASESGDPAVHQLLAERRTCELNIDAAQADLATIKDAEARIVAVNEALAQLGFC